MRGDGLYHRPKSPFWYFKLKENGRWREVSTKERGYQDARRVRRDKIAEQQAGLLPDVEMARWPFERVIPPYLEDAALHLAARTVSKKIDYLVRPKKIFGKVICEKITADHLRQLQKSTKDDGCKASYNNSIVGEVAQVLKFVKVWRRIESDVSRIKEQTKPAGTVLTAEEEARLFQTAATNPEWTVPYAAALIAVSTTARGCELKSLQWKHVDFLNGLASIPNSKNPDGVRLIALNLDAVAGFRLLWARSNEAKGTDPEHFVFPACENGHIDPTRPQKSWQSSWRTLRATAAKGDPEKNIPAMPNLARLGFHRCRYLAITKLGEVGVPDRTIMGLAGHVTKRMLDHYSKARVKAKKDAVNMMTPILHRQDEMSTSKPN